jgi:NAD kinase
MPNQTAPSSLPLDLLRFERSKLEGVAHQIDPTRSVEEVLTAHAPGILRYLRTEAAEMERLRMEVKHPTAPLRAFTPESSRSPYREEPARITLDRIIVVSKQSKLEWDQQHLGVSRADLLEHYRREGINGEAIVQSHERQQQALRVVSSYLQPNQIVTRDQITPELAAKAELVIAIGGDNHLQYVSHFVRDGFFFGINSDPLKSEGALMQHAASDFPRLLSLFERGEFEVEEWTRLEAQVNGKPLPLSVCDLFFGEAERQYMSRYIVNLNGQHEEQKSSGLLVATGSGSSGWYDSAGRFLNAAGDRFPRTAPEARFLITEPYQGRLNGSALLTGVLRPGDVLEVRSLNDSRGLAVSDSLDSLPFGRGAIAQVKISACPLKVLRPRAP